MTASVRVLVDVGGEDLLPHTFIEVTHPDGTTTEYGFAPSTGGELLGAGKVYITGTTPDNSRHLKPTGTKSYAKAFHCHHQNH